MTTMQRVDLIQHCMDLLESFNPNKATIDDHADEYVQEKRIMVCSIVDNLLGHAHDLRPGTNIHPVPL